MSRHHGSTEQRTFRNRASQPKIDKYCVVNREFKCIAGTAERAQPNMAIRQIRVVY